MPRFLEPDSSTPPLDVRAPQRPLGDQDIEKILNYGSDMDSDDENLEDVDDEEMVGIPTRRPRRTLIYMETPLDPILPLPSQESSSSPLAALPINIGEDAPLPLTSPAEPIATAGLQSRGRQAAEQPAWMSDPFYKFEWQPYPDIPFPPYSRRETFDSSDCGPTVSCFEPYSVFVSIWDQRMMEQIASETDRYSQQLTEQMIAQGCLYPTSRICAWTNTNPDELYVYFGIILAMGVVVKSRLEEYWSVDENIFITPGFRAYMSLKRFQLLSKCLHFNNNDDMHTQNLNLPEAKLFKIEPIITHLNERFQAMYNMSQNIALDESLLQWKGWLGINQHITNKAAVIGIKSYEICESQTGYLWRFKIHAHSAAPKPPPHQEPLSGTTPVLVLDLIRGLEHKGYTVWMDNFYNSPILARKLKTLGMDCVGTLRTNRFFVPAQVTETKGQMAEGEVTGVTSGDVDILVWRDANRVATISTYHGNAVTTDDQGKTKPILIQDYNVMMGGVDKKDQLLSMYPIERKRSAVWYKKLFRRLLNVSVLNSYIIHRKHRDNLRILSHRTFRMTLINDLLKHSSQLTIWRPLLNKGKILDVRTHYPDEYPFLPSGKARQRRVCVKCHKRTTTHCVGCKKPACIRCFKNLH